MKKLNLITSLFLITFCFSQISCQSQGAAGVYSGVELSLSPMMGGGMDRDDVTFYLRPDKTFTDEVDKPDWKTAVRGNWSQSGKKITVTYKPNDEGKVRTRELELTDKGNLQTGTGYTLKRMEIANSIPKGVYEYKYASGSGGMGTGMVYVGSSGNRLTAFDGKGNFTQESSSVVAVIGDNIGGGTNSDKSAFGTYTVKDGTLTFKFADGKTSSHSLFVCKDWQAEPMIFVDGKATFMLDKKELAEKMKDDQEDAARDRKKPRTDEGNARSGNQTSTGTGSGEMKASSLSASDLLSNVKSTHGGNAIDQLKTSSVKGTVNGLEIRALNDYDRGWVRTETRQRGKILMVEQLEGNSGWQWVKGKKSALSAARIKELQAGLYTGFGGLKSNRIASLKSGKVQEKDGMYTLIYQVNGQEMAMLMSPDFQMKGEARQTAAGIETTTYDNFRQSNGLLVPFTEVHAIGGNKLSINITEFQVNQASEADWGAVTQ